MNFIEKRNHENIHKNTLELIYLMIMGISFVTLLTNFVNNRPFSVYIMSIIAFFLSGFLYYFSKFKGKFYYSKIIFFIIFNIIYIPYAWLTSPGSISAMPLFSLFVITISVLFVEKEWELTFPFITIIESGYLFYFEMKNPDFLKPFLNSQVRLQDVSLNYIVLSTSILIIIYRINKFYVNQHTLVYKKSVTDQLTKVYNRRYLMKVLLENKSNLLNFFNYYTVIMIDINNFKSVNDIYGHLIGDEVLKDLGKLLNSSCREYDICGRYGGDEFMVILPETSVEDASNYFKRIEKSFLKLNRKYNKVDFSLAYGIANSKDKSVKEIIDLADEQLYSRKRSC